MSPRLRLYRTPFVGWFWHTCMEQGSAESNALTFCPSPVASTPQRVQIVTGGQNNRPKSRPTVLHARLPIDIESRICQFWYFRGGLFVLSEYKCRCDQLQQVKFKYTYGLKTTSITNTTFIRVKICLSNLPQSGYPLQQRITRPSTYALQESRVCINTESRCSQ